MSEDFQRFRDRPAPAVLALFVATVVGLFGGLALRDDEAPADDPNTITFSGESGVPTTGATGGAFAETAESRDALLAATKRGVDLAESNGDRASAVVWPVGWVQPVVVPGSTPSSGQMWSLSKPVASVAAYKAAISSSPGAVPSADLLQGIKDAIRRSDNCGQRRVVLGLQKLSGDSQAKAIKAFEDVLSEGGVTAETGGVQRTQDAVDASDCDLYLKSVAPIQGGTKSPAVQFGTANWTTQQAAAFAHALASGTYGAAGEHVLKLMGQSKLGPRPDTNKNPLIPKDPKWGAGNAFSGLSPAYKSGWGGKTKQNFSATQLVIVRGVDPPVAIVAVVYPKKPVTDEDPEKTTAPSGLEAIFRQIRTQMEGGVPQQ